MSETTEQWGLLVSFDDQSHSFVHGYEAGMLWERMQQQADDPDAVLISTIHEANVPLVGRMGAYLGWSPWFSESEVEGWVDVRLARAVGSGVVEQDRQANDAVLSRPSLRVIEGRKGGGDE